MPPATPATGAGKSPVPAETPTAPASKPPVKSARDAVTPKAPPSTVEDRYRKFLDESNAKPTGSAEPTRQDTLLASSDLDGYHTAAQDALRSYSATLFGPAFTPEDIAASEENLTYALSDGGMTQYEIDAVRASLNDGDIPNVQPHPSEPRLTHVAPETIALSS